MKILFITLGCDKNRVDSEKMLSLLMQDGHTITDDEYEAEVIVVNTCSFILDSKEESIETLIEMARMKEEGNCKLLICAGCLGQRYKDEFFESLPEVDAIVGTASWDLIREAINEAQAKEHTVICESIDRLPLGHTGRCISTGGHYAYLKIAEGCARFCTYCAIPSLRGKYRSVPMEELVEEAEKLVDNGVKELILIAQETTLYGIDLYGKKSLPELIKKLAGIEGLYWIRLLYCYPEEVDDALIEVIKNEPKVCKYIDMPIQHINDGILKAMGRRTNGAQIRDLIAKLREEIPEIALRTTLIAGFPGETEEAFDELCDFVEETRFDRLGCFAYSAEEGTPAAEFPDQIDDEEKEARRDEIMAIQQEISLDKGQEFIGKTLEIFVEGTITEEGTAVGRSYRDAPDVDGYVFFDTPGTESGRFINVEITGASEYDLIGEAL